MYITDLILTADHCSVCTQAGMGGSRACVACLCLHATGLIFETRPVRQFLYRIGRGMAASRDLQVGEVIVSTPHYLFLNTEDIQSSRFAHVILQVRLQMIMPVTLSRCRVEQSGVMRSSKNASILMHVGLRRSLFMPLSSSEMVW